MGGAPAAHDEQRTEERVPCSQAAQVIVLGPVLVLRLLPFHAHGLSSSALPTRYRRGQRASVALVGRRAVARSPYTTGMRALSYLLLLIWRYLPRRARRVVLWRMNSHWIVAVYAIVPRHDTHVLLAQHPHDHGQWRLPGGTLKRREQPAEGLRRELWEELGLDVVSVQLIHSEMHDRSVQLYYRVEVEGVFRPSLEVTGWRPWPLDALPADLWPQQRRAIVLATTP